MKLLSLLLLCGTIFCSPLRYEFNHRTRTLTFYDVIPSMQEIKKITLQELKEKFKGYQEITAQYTIKLEREDKPLAYTFDPFTGVHTLKEIPSDGVISQYLRLPFPFDILYLPAGRPLLSPDETRELSCERMKILIAIESFEEAELDVQKQILHDVLREVGVNRGVNFWYVQFALHRWYTHAGISYTRYVQLTALNKFLHSSMGQGQLAGYNSCFILTEEEERALWTLQQDRNLIGGLGAAVCLGAVISCPEIPAFIGRTYAVKQVIKITQCGYKTLDYWDYNKVCIDNDIIIEFRKSNLPAEKYVADKSWWDRISWALSWGISL